MSNQNYLFDASPDDIPDESQPSSRKKAKKKPDSPAPAAQTEDAGAGVALFSPKRRLGEEIIGRSEGHYSCADERCGSAYFDILDEWKDEWRIECMVCGTGQRVPAISGVIKIPDDSGEFVFADGRYEGLSLAQVAADKHGPTYIAWAAEKHKREAVRAACKKWIDVSCVRP